MGPFTRLLGLLSLLGLLFCTLLRERFDELVGKIGDLEQEKSSLITKMHGAVAPNGSANETYGKGKKGSASAEALRERLKVRARMSACRSCFEGCFAFQVCFFRCVFVFLCLCVFGFCRRSATDPVVSVGVGRRGWCLVEHPRQKRVVKLVPGLELATGEDE